MLARDLRFLRLLGAYALFLIALHLLVERLPVAWASFWYPQKLIGPGGRLSPHEWLWGMYPITYLPAWLRYLALGMAAGVTLWAGFGLGRKAAPRLRALLSSFAFPRQSRVHFLLALASFPLFYGARVVHTRWGDAYILVHGIAHPDLRLTYNWQAPLDTYVHARLFHLGERLWGWSDALPAYWWLSSLCGAAAVWVLLRLAAEIGRNDRQRWTLFGLLAMLGAMQLFFGYPENYTIISLLILIYLWLGWRVSQGRASLWAPSLALALAHAFHPATLVLQPSLWLLAFPRAARANANTVDAVGADGIRPNAIRPYLAALPALVLPAFVAAAGVLALMTAGGHGLDAFLGDQAPGGSDQRWFVPLTAATTEWEYYTLLSRGHLIEIANQQWLVAPFTLPLLLLLVGLYRVQLPRDHYSLFLAAAAGCYLLLIWTWNPDYGGQRDWDLFAPAAWPATLLAAYWLTRTVNAATLARAAVIMVLVQGIHTTAWVYSNTQPWEWP